MCRKRFSLPRSIALRSVSNTALESSITGAALVGFALVTMEVMFPLSLMMPACRAGRSLRATKFKLFSRASKLREEPDR